MFRPAGARMRAPIALSSNGYNLSTDTSCGLTAIGDHTGVNALLGPLANDGGPTETEALKPGSRPSTPSSRLRPTRPTSAASTGKAPATSGPTSASLIS